MNKRIVVYVVLSLLILSVPTFAQKIIGEHVGTTLETPHPYYSISSEGSIHEDQIHFPGATYISVHFSHFDLAPGDHVVVRSEDGNQTWTYQNQGRKGLGVTKAGFFATHIKGDTVYIELFTSGSGSKGYGYDIDFFGRGYSDKEIRDFWSRGLGDSMDLVPPAPDGSGYEAICGADDSTESKCLDGVDLEMYEESRAVARLVKNGNAHCTGWLIGCEGHIMTNQHCIATQAELDTIDFEFMAQGANCSTNCASSLACPGTLEATGGTLVKVNSALDYALVMPDTTVGGNTDLVATYGHMQLRQTGAVVGERIYIPQHPAGWGKRIAYLSTDATDASGFCEVETTTAPVCAGGTNDVGYHCDTQGGSSGSPVLGYSDHRVVALHHCANCPNRGVPIQDVVTDLGADLPNCSVCQVPGTPTGLTATANGDNRIDLTWSGGSPAAATFNVYRAIGSCPQTGYVQIASGLVGTSFNDTSASGSVNYAYVVTAVDASGGCETDFSNCDNATTTGPCTQTPTFAGLTSVTNTQNSSCQLDLSWSAATGHCGSVTYDIFRSTTSGFTPGPGNRIETGYNSTSYSDAGLTYNQSYFYVVRAVDSTAGSETNSAEQTAKPTGPVGPVTNYSSTDTPIAIPDNNSGGTTSTLNVGGSGPVFNAELNVNINHTYKGDLALVLSSPGAANSVTVHNRSGGTTEDIITTYDTLTMSDGPGNMSDFADDEINGNWTLNVSDNASADTGNLNSWSLDVQVGSTCASCPLPDAPTGVTASVPGSNQIQLDWNPVSGTVTYHIYRSTGSCPAGSFVEVGTTTHPTTTFTDNTTSGGVTYSYHITTKDSCTESNPSTCDDATATGSCVTTPTFGGLDSATDASGNTCSIDLAWQAATSNCAGTITYDVFRGTSPGFTVNGGSRIATGVSSTSYADSAGLTNGSTYYYVVRAVGSVAGTESNGTERSASSTGPGGGTATFSSTDVPKTLFDAGQTLSTVSVTGISNIGDLNVVNLAGTHTWMGDLDFVLESPAATSVTILDTGSCGNVDNFDLSLDDESGNGPSGCPPTSGTDQTATNLLSAFDSEDPTGTWTLTITDGASADTGTLNTWGLEITDGTSGTCTTGATGPSEASPSGSPMTSAVGSGSQVDLTYTASCNATDHVVYRGAGPISGSLNFTAANCALGTSGSTMVDPGTPSSGSFFYWVLVGQSATVEGSFGLDSTGSQRPEAGTVGSCPLAQDTSGSCP